MAKKSKLNQPKKRSYGIFHAIKVAQGQEAAQGTSRQIGDRKINKRPKPSMPKLPWEPEDAK